MASISKPTSNIDFTNYNCAYANLELNKYPDFLQPTVDRIRTLSKVDVNVNKNMLLGSGGFGVVYQAHYEREPGKAVVCAVKIFLGPRGVAECSHEASMLWKSIGVTNTVGLHGFASCQAEPIGAENVIVIDYVQGCNLAQLSLLFEPR